MGLTAIVSSAASSASSAASSSAVSATVTSLLSPVGAGIGGLFVAVALVFLLAYLDVLDASETDYPEVRRTVVATIVPLLLAFGGVVLFKSLQFV